MPEFKLVRKFNEKGDTTERKIEVKIKDKVRRINTRKKKTNTALGHRHNGLRRDSGRDTRQ